MKQWITALVFSLVAVNSWALNLDQLEAQLSQPQVIRGQFVQEKHLRDLPIALKSQGTYALSKQHGLLWFLEKPIAKHYRINRSGVAMQEQEQWLLQPKQEVVARQSQLFLAVLQGDRSGLEQDFDLALTGDLSAWQLTLTPRSVFLKQIFDKIEIAGAQQVDQIILFEAQGDRTQLNFVNSQLDQSLTADESTNFGL